MENCKACRSCIAHPVCDKVILLYSERCMVVMKSFYDINLNATGKPLLKIEDELNQLNHKKCKA